MAIQPDSTTISLAHKCRASGIEIPELVPIADLPWGQLAGYRIDAVNAAAEWSRLRATVVQTGYYPLIAIDDRGLLVDPSSTARANPEGVIRAAEEIRLEEWFERMETYPVGRGEWPSIEPHSELLALYSHFHRAWRSPVFMLLLPARESWKALAYVGPGAWNSRPSAEEHCALFRRWQEKYGAEVMLVSDDVIEARVSRPPVTKENALILAREHHLYCDDTVAQNLGTLDALGAEVMNCPLWYFWWD